MIKATHKDKQLIIDILTQSFEHNKSVNYIIKQDERKLQRIASLMRYAFEYCYLFGEVFLSDDKKGCALMMYPDKKKIKFKTMLLDLQLILTAVGFGNIRKTLRREAMINRIQPQGFKTYLWFIGVDTVHQNKGVGSKLLNEIIMKSELQKRPIYLETSTLKNVPWYQQFGFTIYHEENTGYPLYFMNRELNKG